MKMVVCSLPEGNVSRKMEWLGQKSQFRPSAGGRLPRQNGVAWTGVSVCVDFRREAMIWIVK